MTMITPSYLGETIEYSSLHACRSTLEDPTHPVNEIIPGNAVRPEDFHGEVQINGIGQNSQGLFSKLGKSCPAQHVNYILPSRLHRACPTLLRNLTVSLAAASRHTAADVRAFPSAWQLLAS